jgi:hypothetical protein
LNFYLYVKIGCALGCRDLLGTIVASRLPSKPSLITLLIVISH